MFTDGSRLEDGAAGYAVAWKTGQTWKGIKTHMGYNQEAYDTECAALARALESASRRNTVPERVTIFTDAQAAIRWMASDEPGPGQKYVLEARKHIATMRRARPGIIIEIRWCPAHNGVEGNENADEWAKLAAEEPDTRGVEWMPYSDRTEVRPMPLPRSLANIRREISEKKWTEARRWAGGRTSNQKYRLPETHRPDVTVAGSTKRLASRFYQLKAGHCRTGQYLRWACCCGGLCWGFGTSIHLLTSDCQADSQHFGEQMVPGRNFINLVRVLKGYYWPMRNYDSNSGGSAICHEMWPRQGPGTFSEMRLIASAHCPVD